MGWGTVKANSRLSRATTYMSSEIVVTHRKRLKDQWMFTFPVDKRELHDAPLISEDSMAVDADKGWESHISLGGGRPLVGFSYSCG